MLRGKWWEVYGDPQLNQLEERIANNQALRQAMENYLAARDQVAVVRSTLFPTLSFGLACPHTQIVAQSAAGDFQHQDQLQRSDHRRAGKMGARFLGPRPPQC